MEHLKLILKKIGEDLDQLGILIDQKLASKNKENESEQKSLDKSILKKINSNLNDLDEIIKDLDDNY
tara:strand:- start:214 stop:414 length:201 start_codon:yes stop_codon:yes gene_type:complete